jgi:hypothetical protein
MVQRVPPLATVPPTKPHPRYIKGRGAKMVSGSGEAAEATAAAAASAAAIGGPSQGGSRTAGQLQPVPHRLSLSLWAEPQPVPGTTDTAHFMQVLAALGSTVHGPWYFPEYCALTRTPKVRQPGSHEPAAAFPT